MIRLNTSIPPSKDPKRLGVLAGDKAGFPNGRRLTDDVVDISLQVVEGKLLGAKIPPLGDAVNANDKAFGGTFPYVALPWSGSDVKGTGSGTKPAAASAASNPRVSQLNASTVADEKSTTSSPVLPLVAVGVGAMFLGGAGALLWRRRRSRLPSA
jgi:LPXTG-motif cell wall-anchored protein